MGFEDRVAELIAYRAEHGGDPPVRKDGKILKLGQWLNRQRYYRRQGELAPEREKRLEQIGIEWEPATARKAKEPKPTPPVREGAPAEEVETTAETSAASPEEPASPNRQTEPIDGIVVEGGANAPSLEPDPPMPDLPSGNQGGLPGMPGDDSLPPAVAGLGMASGHDTPEIEAWNLAKDLVQKGVKPPAASGLTGLQQEAMRRLYKQIHKEESRRGPSPYYARSLVDNTRRSAHGALAVEAYRTVTEQSGPPKHIQIDPEALIRAHNIYTSTLPPGEPPLSLEATWHLLRDLRIGELELKFCSSCGVNYLYCLQQESLLRCPFCAPYINRGAAPDR